MADDNGKTANGIWRRLGFGEREGVFDDQKELKYQAKRTGLSFVGRRAAVIAGQTAESGATLVSEGIAGSVGSVMELIVGAEIARNLGSIAGAIGGSIVGLVGLGLAAAVSASFTQMDYIHKKNNLTDFYRGDLAAKLGKEPGKVTVQDLEAEAENNRTLKEELNRARRQRNFGVPLAAVATLASFALVMVALPALVAAAGLPALAGIGGFLVKAVVSVAGYYAVKTPLQSWGDKKFGLSDETPNDRIAELHRAHGRGEAVTPQQVLGVFAKANASIDALVVERTGKPYDQLNAPEQQQAVQALSDTLPLGEIAQGLNTGRIRATQLAFAAEGEFPATPPTGQAMDGDGPAIAQEAGTHFRGRLEAKVSASYAERISQRKDAADPSIPL